MHKIDKQLNSEQLFSGIITALITPIKNKDIDYTALERLINKQKLAGIKSLIIGGSTGEGTLLSSKQYFDLIATSINHAQDKKINIIAGLTSLNINNAIDKLNHLHELGVQAIMCTPPPYVRPEQHGLVEYFKQLDQASKLPLMLYIVPSRTNCNFTNQTILEIIKLQNFMAVKDASGDVFKPMSINNSLSQLKILGGDDPQILSCLINGGSGVVSVMANLVPALMRHIYELYQHREIKIMQSFYRKLMPLMQAIFNETNPIGIKYALYKTGYIEDEIITPLTSANIITRKKIDAHLDELIELEANIL